MSSLKSITPFVFGTTRLGHDDRPFEDRVSIALQAMESGVWFHTSHQYDNALDVLSRAFKENPGKIPKLIVKIGWHSILEIRDNIKLHLDQLGISSIEVGQLCLENPLKEDFEKGGKCYDDLQKILEEGWIKNWVLEVFPWTSQTAIKAIRNGFAERIIQGYIFYFNPLQRFASNTLWDILHERNETIIAMRTVSGGPVHKLRDVPGAAWKEYLQKRATEVAPIFEKSGIQNWTEFCIRFAHSFPQVISTVGSTNKSENLNDFLKASSARIEALDQRIIEQITLLQQRWSDELDIHAEPWSM